MVIGHLLIEQVYHLAWIIDLYRSIDKFMHAHERVVQTGYPVLYIALFLLLEMFRCPLSNKNNIIRVHIRITCAPSIFKHTEWRRQANILYRCIATEHISFSHSVEWKKPKELTLRFNVNSNTKFVTVVFN